MVYTVTSDKITSDQITFSLTSKTNQVIDDIIHYSQSDHSLHSMGITAQDVMNRDRKTRRTGIELSASCRLQ